MIQKQDLNVKVDFGKTLPSAEKIFVRMVDVDTGEVLYDASKVVGFSCCANGEGYIYSLFASFVRGLRSARNLSIEITATPVHSDFVVPALF